MGYALVRDGVQADRPALRRVWQAAWRATYAPVVGEAGVDAILRSLDASDFADMLPGRDERLLVATRDGQVVGSAVYVERLQTAYLWGMYVHPDHHRRGTGTALLAHLAPLLLPATRVEARVLLSSAVARAFYGRCGFVGAEPTAVRLAESLPEVPAVVMATSVASLRELATRGGTEAR